MVDIQQRNSVDICDFSGGRYTFLLIRSRPVSFDGWRTFVDKIRGIEDLHPLLLAWAEDYHIVLLFCNVLDACENIYVVIVDYHTVGAPRLNNINMVPQEDFPP